MRQRRAGRPPRDPAPRPAPAGGSVTPADRRPTAHGCRRRAPSVPGPARGSAVPWRRPAWGGPPRARGRRRDRTATDPSLRPGRPRPGRPRPGSTAAGRPVPAPGGRRGPGGTAQARGCRTVGPAPGSPSGGRERSSRRRRRRRTTTCPPRRGIAPTLQGRAPPGRRGRARDRPRCGGPAEPGRPRPPGESDPRRSWTRRRGRRAPTAPARARRCGTPGPSVRRSRTRAARVRGRRRGRSRRRAAHQRARSRRRTPAPTPWRSARAAPLGGARSAQGTTGRAPGSPLRPPTGSARRSRRVPSAVARDGGLRPPVR